ncbi:MAG: NGG1p interacting factor NIF3 [Candidatus Falkowbacteria bacterium]|nr:MAG: NGG1p interacting factor NIF3 [Candidatus Falkowbacteria bacterium]
MKTKEIYDLAIKLGMKADLRGEAEVKKYLARVNKKYEALPEKDKGFFDMEKLSNPYSDARVLFDNGREVKKIMVGIDIETAELLLAKQLGDIDLVIAHHPEGSALADLSDVMALQAQVLASYGVPINIAESVIKSRISEVHRGISPINHDRAVDAARALDTNFMCIHTPADNLGASFMENLVQENREKLDTVGDLMELLMSIPEYAEAKKRKAGPMIFAGSEDSSCGKIVVTEFTGGTSGSKDIYEKMSQYGIGTIIGMHMSEEHRKEAEKYHINVVIAGHMASDSLGMNLLLDEIEKQGIEIMSVSGLIRIKRS